MEFTRELMMANTKAAMKEAGAPSADLWQIAPEKIKVMPGYNARTQGEKFEQRVRWLADRMKANGYDRKHPLGGFVSTDGIMLTAGHRRLAAVKLAISEGSDIECVPMVVSPRGAGMEELTLELITSNEGEPLTVYEKSIVVKRLAAFGWSAQKIAEKVGFASAQYVDGLLMLAGAPLAIRKMVIEDVVSATEAINAIRKHGAGALDVLIAALAASAGGRVTAKNLPNATFNKAIKRHAPQMYAALTDIQKDPAYGLIDEALRGKITDMILVLTKE